MLHRDPGLHAGPLTDAVVTASGPWPELWVATTLVVAFAIASSAWELRRYVGQRHSRIVLDVVALGGMCICAFMSYHARWWAAEVPSAEDSGYEFLAFLGILMVIALIIFFSTRHLRYPDGERVGRPGPFLRILEEEDSS